MSTASTISEAAIFSRVVETDRGNLSPETARRWLALGFPARDRRRVEALTKKADAGRISDKERDELDNYLHVADMLAVMHSRARRVLALAEDGD
jgi:hypothetical protein